MKRTMIINACAVMALVCTGGAVAFGTTYGDSTADNWGPVENDILSVDINNDATNLSFTIYLNTSADLAVNYYSNYEIGIQTNNGAGGQTVINNNYGLGDPTIGSGYGTPVGISTGMTHFIGSYLDGPGYSGGAELFEYSTVTGWAKVGWTAAITQVSTGTPSVAFSLPLADLGLSAGESFSFDVWSTYSGANSAYDALQNPLIPFNGTSDVPWSSNGLPPANYDSATHNGSLLLSRPYTITGSSATSGTWTGAASATWSDSGNWSGGVPDGAGHSATFDSTAAGNFAVSVDGSKTVGAIAFAGTTSYTLGGAGSLTLEATSGAATISASAGSHSIVVPVTLNDDLTVTTAASSHVAFTAAMTATGRAVSKEGPGSAQFEHVRAASLSVISGSLRMSQKGAANVEAGTSVVSALAIASGAELDLKNNSLVVDYADGNLGTLLADVRAHLLAGRLTTTSASTHRLGYVNNGTRTSFGGVSVDPSSVLIGYAIPGDSDLGGLVDFDDLLVLAQNYGLSDRFWDTGDYDYNGSVEFSDLLLLAQNYGVSGFVTGVDFASDWALARSLVPEPTLGLVAGMVAASLIRRRRVSDD